MNFDYLANLNKSQEEAVLHLNGPLLIVAGAGSGKTRVLTSRIAHIVKQHKAFPNQILAVTFTNKAAKEMQLRVSNFLKKEATGLPWLGTFHSISAKILRKHAEAVELKSNFTIIDQDDQVRLIKNICKSENIDTKKISPKYILAVIDKWKGTIVSPNVSCLNCFQNTFKMRSVSLGDTISEDAGMVLLRGLTDCSMTLSETIGCVASSGVHVLVVMCSKSSNIVQAHPLIPTLLVSSFTSSSHSHDVDLRLGHDVLENARSMCDVVASVVSSKLSPHMNRIGNVHFQFSRGRTGVSV